MIKVAGVRFKKMGKIYYFDPQDLTLEEGLVVVETANGLECGELVYAEKEVEDREVTAPLKKIVRQATPADEQRLAEREQKKEESMRICAEKVAAHNLEMKLIDVDIAFDGSKITFFFTADGRVDFRELVKDLAHVFRTRIELRQIGVRDETKMLGGIGACGRVCCCTQYLKEFAPVSIKMAKEQNLSLNPTKISGLCGRLMCCLKYEQNYYEEMRHQMPRQGKEVATPDGPGLLLENNVLKKTCRVRITLPDQTMDVRTYSLEDIQRAQQGLPPLKEASAEEEMPDVVLRGEVQNRPQQPQQRRNDRPSNSRRRPQQQENAPADAKKEPARDGNRQNGNRPQQNRSRNNGQRPQQNRSRNNGQRPQNAPKGDAAQETVTLRPAEERSNRSASARHRGQRRPRPQNQQNKGGEEVVRLVPAQKD